MTTTTTPATTQALRLEFVTGRPAPDVLACEAEVFGRWYGNTADDLELAYGPYEEATGWIVLRSDDGVVGWCRVLMPGARPLKTITDVAAPPWSLDGAAAARAAGVDLTRTWDVATIGVHDRAGGARRLASAALYHGLVLSSWVNGAAWMVAILDRHVLALLEQVGLTGRPLPGAEPRPYFGSPSSLPVYAEFAQSLRRQRLTHPDAYRAVALGAGLTGVEVPPLAAFLAPQTVTVDLTEADERTVGAPA